MDLFKDYFTRETLAKTLLKTPYVPGRLGESGLFATRGLTSTTALIEELPSNAVTADAASIARGAPAISQALDARKMHSFQAASYAWQQAILADEVLNVRAAGSGSAEVISSRVADATAKLRRKADMQAEYLRMAVLKAPSNSIGNAPASAAIAVQTDATKLRDRLFTVITLQIEAALGGIPYTGIRVFCSEGYWVKLIENAWIKATYLNSNAAAVLRDSGLSEEVTVAGITFERYRGSGSLALATDTAIAVPEGVDELFLQCFAPDDTLDSVGVGAMGAPYYLRSELIPGNKGWRLVLQTHPVMVCNATDTASATANLTSSINLVAVASALSTAVAGLSTDIPLVGNAVDVAAATGNLSSGIPLGGSASDTATASGTLNSPPIALAGAALSVATATDTLSTQIPLTGPPLAVCCRRKSCYPARR